MATGAESEILELGYFRPGPVPTRTLTTGRGRLRGDRAEERPRRAGGRHADRVAARPATQPLPGYQPGPAARLRGHLPAPRRRLPAAARRARQAPPQRRELRLRAGVERCAGHRLPLRVPGPAPHGDRPGAPGARVRPRPHRLGAERRVPRAARSTAAPRSSSTTPRRCRRRRDRVDRRAVGPGQVLDARTDYIGPLMELATGRRGEFTEHGVPRPRRASTCTSRCRSPS